MRFLAKAKIIVKVINDNKLIFTLTSGVLVVILGLIIVNHLEEKQRENEFRNKIKTSLDYAERLMKRTKYEDALIVYNNLSSEISEKNDPFYGKLNFNLGMCHWRLSEKSNNEKNMLNSIYAFMEALKIYTIKKYPLDYATTQNNIGLLYSELAEIRDTEENLKKTVQAYKEALKIYTIKKYPLDYATTQSNLGVAYAQFSYIRDIEGNLKKAVQGFKEALKFFTIEKYPLTHKRIMSNIEKIKVMKKFYDSLPEKNRKAIEGRDNK